MNAEERKLDLFRKIDNIKESELENFYSKFIALLSARSSYKLSKDEKVAIAEALEASDYGKDLTEERAIKSLKSVDEGRTRSIQAFKKDISSWKENRTAK